MVGTNEIYSELSPLFCRLDTPSAALVLEKFSGGDIAVFLDGQPAELCSRVLECLSPNLAASVIVVLDAQLLNGALRHLDLNLAAMLLSRLSDDQQALVLERLGQSYQSEIRSLLEYPPESAGALMDTRVAAFRVGTRVSEVCRKLKEFRDRRVHNIFVVDDRNCYVGKVALQDLVLADENETVGALSSSEVPAVDVFSPREEVVALLNAQSLSSIPVIDFEGRLLGVIRNETLVKAVQEEATANIQTMFGAGKEERALSPVFFAVKKRLPWLEINLVTAFLAASVVGMFEDTIAKFTALAVLLPVVAGQSGNTGAQALAVAMRGLTIREIRVKHWLRLVWKEARVGFFNGVAVALTTSLGVFIWSRSVGLALIIGLSMVISMVAAGASGAAVPLVLTALRQDPAQSSSIVLTTVTDVVGFFSFLGIATILMGML